MNFQFDSRFVEVGRIPNFSSAVIKNEPMLFSCDWDHAWDLGGPITRTFMDQLPQSWKATPNVVVDSRVHMLMKGWFPCIPGWHLDDVPRTRLDGQPDHIDPKYRSQHVMAVVGDASLTHFAVGRGVLQEPPPGKVIYEQWHHDIEYLVHTGQLKEIEIRDGSMVEFDWQAFHRGMMAWKDGWRWFIRMSTSTERPITNELRRQVQVYLPNVNGGW